MGTGVVVSSGREGDEFWQVTAGLMFDRRKGGVPAIWMDSFDLDRQPTGQLTETWDGGSVQRGGALGVGDRAIAIAFIPAGADVIPWANEDGSTTLLATASAPALMSAASDPFEGSVGWAVVADARGGFQA